MSRQALVAYRGNLYALPSELGAAIVTVVRMSDDLTSFVTTGRGESE